ncbi:MAG: aspartate-semialdehyde dehydrogenase [Deltaproteobacteria bacterium]|nr:aspartate-semialdehyde dehydrogenase [Deltaproteobacteria bacterium]
MKRIKVGILGGTGMVGQRFIQLLDGHPWFEVTEVAASERSAGRPYGEVMEGRWKLEGDIPPSVAQLLVKECTPELDCRLVFSALDANVAGPIEEEFAQAGYVVSSNSRNHRMAPDVPLLVPEVNPDHLEVIPIQKRRWARGGYIITNPNCSVIGLVMPLAPLHKRFGVTKAIVTTLQALSGAGYPGVASLDIIDNVVPFIGGEEAKVETEPLKILGCLEDGRFVFAELKVSASCTRVNVRDGHMESVSVELKQEASPEDLIETWEEFDPLAGYGLPSAPSPPIVVRRENDRPQPRRDRDEGRGMACVVGRVRECPILDYKFFVLSHNTIRGAAGAAVLNAEYLYKKGYL